MLYEEVKHLTCKDRCNNVMRDLLTFSCINVNNIDLSQNTDQWSHVNLSHWVSCPDEFIPVFKPLSLPNGRDCCLSDHFSFFSS